MTPSTHGFLFLAWLAKLVEQAEDPASSERHLRQFAERIYGAEDAFFPGNRSTAAVTTWHQYRSVIKDSMGVCDWVFPAMRRTFETAEARDRAAKTDVRRIFGDPGAEARLYRACTGVDMDIAEMERPIAERIVNLERCIDVRNTGRSRTDDEAVIPHFQWPEKTDGTHFSADASEFHAMLDDYYALRGWDKETGHPFGEKLAELGLQEVAEALHGEACGARAG
jgi:aldehyde:ferredoxin oxidoreductase